MRHGKWRVATSAFIAVTLLVAPVWAGAGDKTIGVNEDDSGVYESLKLKLANENGASGDAIRSMRTEPPATNRLAVEALADLELVWDNSFEGNTGGFSFASQCGSLDCDTAVSNVNFDPLSLLVDDIDLPQGTVVRGVKIRFLYGFPTVPRDDEFEGVVVSIYENRTNAPGLPAGTDAPDNTLQTLGSNRFQLPVTDPDFLLISEGFASRRVEAVFPAGQQWMADGNKKWIGISPVLDFNIPGAQGPQTFTRMTDAPLFNPVVQAFVPPDATQPFDFENPPNSPTARIVDTFDTAFQLFGSAASGGQAVITLFDNPSPSAGCTISLKVTQELLSDCTSVACPDDPILGAGCSASYTVVGGDTASMVAAGLAANFNPANCGGPVNVTMTAVGPRLIVTTDDGPAPLVCMGGGGAGLIGGQLSCEQTGCGLRAQARLNASQSLPAIPPGSDWLRTVKDCGIVDGVGTWQEFNLPASMFNLPGGLAPALSGFSGRIAFEGVGRAFFKNDADTIVDRLEPIRFDTCNGDSNLDGLVDAADQAALTACLATPTDANCLALFDYDNSGAVDGADQDVLDCLVATGNSSDCCPPTFDGNPSNPANYPRRASSDVSIDLQRLFLRSCAPIEILRTGQTAWPECWWVQHFLSNVEPRVGSGTLGVCTLSESEPNDNLASATSLGVVTKLVPVRRSGAISSAACDASGQINIGQNDGDVYTFTVPFTDLVTISVRGRGTAKTCDGVGINCSCPAGANAVTSVWLFDGDGVGLLASDDPPLPACDNNTGTCDNTPTCNVGSAPGDCCCSPIAGVTSDPSVERVLAPGTYTLVVGSAAQIAVPNPNDIDGCVIGDPAGFDVANNDEGPTTGNYEVNIAVTDRSTMSVTQTNQFGGTFDSRLLVQALTTLERVADPFAAILIDTGELGQDAVILESQGGPWVNNLNDPNVIPGDANFIPGLAADNVNVQTPVQIQHVDNLANPAASTVVHLVEPPTLHKCIAIESTCLVIQNPNDLDLDSIGSATVNSGATEFKAADDFVLSGAATIMSVTTWQNPAGQADVNDGFDVRILADGVVTGGCNGPDEANVICDFQDLPADVIRPTELGNADRVTVNLNKDLNGDGDFDDPGEMGCPLTAGTYWMEIKQDLDVSPGQVFFMLSDEGNGLLYHDVGPIDDMPVDDDPDGNCPDFESNPLLGDGYDCTPYVDVPSTTLCNEADCGNGDENCVGAAFPGDQRNIDLAMCLSEQKVQPFTKALPFDVACGDWRVLSGQRIWNQPHGRATGDGSDFNFPSTDNAGQETADDFTFFQDTTILDIHWAGRYDTASPDARIPLGDRFVVTIYNDTNGLPGGVVKQYGAGTKLKSRDFDDPDNGEEIIRSGGMLTGNGGFEIFEYSFDISADPFVANANETYWLSVQNDLRGSPHFWFWVESDGGEANGRSVQRDNAQPWSAASPGAVGDDHAFDLTAGGTLRAYACKSTDCTAASHTATGLGYYFDPRHAWINGYQVKSNDPTTVEGDINRWRQVRAPWKSLQDVDVTPVAADPAGATAAFAEASITITPLEAQCLTEGTAGLQILGVIEGSADFAATAEAQGFDVSGTIDLLCNGQIVAQAGNPSNALSEQLVVKGLRMSAAGSQVSRCIMNPIPGPECFDNFECPKLDVCNRPECQNNFCAQIPTKYGDLNGSGSVNIFDLFCMLDGLNGIFEDCPLEAVDITGGAGDCAPNGLITVFDLFALLDALSAIDPCCGGLPGPAAAQPARDLSADRMSRPVQLKLVASRVMAHPGDVVDVAVYITGASDVRGYELSATVNGGRRGSLDLTSVSIDDRRDYLLSGAEHVKAPDQRGRVVGALYSGGVSSRGAAYLGTFSFRVSDDASGAFRVGLSSDNAVVAGSDKSMISISQIKPATILVTSPARGL